MNVDVSDIVEKIKDRLDPEELIDRLGLTTEELCDILIDYIEEKLTRFSDIYEEDE